MLDMAEQLADVVMKAFLPQDDLDVIAREIDEESKRRLVENETNVAKANAAMDFARQNVSSQMGRVDGDVRDHDDRLRELEHAGDTDTVDSTYPVPASVGIPSNEVDSGFLELFEIYDIDATNNTLKIRGFAGGEACFIGAYRSASSGEATAVAENEDFDTAMTITQNTYFYLKFTSGDTHTVSLESSTAMNDGSVSVELWYLWYVPWDTDHIDSENIVDLRTLPHISGLL